MALLDLRTSTGFDTKNSNVTIITCLQRLAEESDGVRATSFQKAVKALQNYAGGEITSGAMAKKEIPGIGKGIADRIDEILASGTLKEFRPLTAQDKTIQDLCTVTGIGAVRAKKLVELYGITGVPDLIEKYKTGVIGVKPNALTHHIVVGLRFYYDLMERFPRAEAVNLIQKLKTGISAVDTTLLVIPCGSFRRGLPTCGDLDVLLSHPNGGDAKILPKVVDRLTRDEFLVGSLTNEGLTKYMGVCQGSKGGRRIDIRYIDYASLGAAQLYFTGSRTFNILMRNVAIKHGYSLNEYGLWQNEVLIPAHSEGDIFSRLNLVYIPPEERDF